MEFKRKLVDVRKIPLEKFPTPPNGYRWELDANHVYLTDEDGEHECISWDLPGGYFNGYADIDVVWFFLNALQSFKQSDCVL